jgi:hypothetical protein
VTSRAGRDEADHQPGHQQRRHQPNETTAAAPRMRPRLHRQGAIDQLASAASLVEPCRIPGGRWCPCHGCSASRAAAGACAAGRCDLRADIRQRIALAQRWVFRVDAMLAQALRVLQLLFVSLLRIGCARIHRGRADLFLPEAANLFFQLVSGRYERASLIVTSNKPFGRWGEVFGDDTVAAAMIDRLVHHADVIALKGDSYRLKDRDLGRVPAATTEPG